MWMSGARSRQRGFLRRWLPDMDPIARLRALHDTLPSGGAVTFTRADIAEILGIPSVVPAAESRVERDLTVAQVAERTGRRPGTVRDWIRQERLRAYRFRGREYRVTEAALQEFLETERAGKRASKSSNGTPDLGSWRTIRERAS